MVLQADSWKEWSYETQTKTITQVDDTLIHTYTSHGKNLKYIINLKWDRNVYKTRKINKQVCFRWSKIPRGPYPSIGQVSRTLLSLWVPVLFQHRWHCRPSLCRSFQDWIFLSSLHTAVSLEGHPCQLGIRADRLWRESLSGRVEGEKSMLISERCCTRMCVLVLF